MAEQNFDLVVLGGGPGGYVAAIRATQLGLKTAIIDENPQFGGTCLRVGCIPSKALLESSHLLVEARDNMLDHGISATKLTVDLAAMMKRKTKVVDTLTGGINMLLKRNKVTCYVGRGTLAGNQQVSVSTGDTLTAENIIVATGSVPMQLPGVEYDGEFIGDSTTALSYTSVPRRLVVIGGGYIGLELGSVWSRLGSQVTILEGTPQVLPGLDKEIARLAKRTFEKQGLTFKTEMWVESAKRDGDTCVVKCKGAEPIPCDRVLMAAGRSPNTKSIGLDGAGIKADRHGFIEVDNHLQTSAAGTYAIGDCIGGAMLAHKASEEGVAVVEHIANGSGHINYDAIPAVVYTHPEIAMVGKTEEQLKAEGEEYNVGTFPFAANGRAMAANAASGMVKIIADAKTDRILGFHVVGPQASEIVAQGVIAMEFGSSAEDLALTCFAHPTLSESVHEAALAVAGGAIHVANRRKKK